MLTIGPFARLAGVSPKMLRTYDGLGLFRPVWLDRATGYRYYSPAQLPELRRIVALRDVGIGLAEIGRLVAGRGDLRDALERRRTELEDERAEIDRRLAALDIRFRGSIGGEKREMLPGAPAEAEELDVVLRPVAAELVAIRTVGDGEDDADAFDELEAHVRDAGRRARRPPGALVPVRSDWQIFVPLTGRVAETERISVTTLPACRAATAIVRGPYERMAAARAALETWVDAAALSRSGPPRVLYLQFGAPADLRLPAGYVVERAEDYVTELQLPIG